MVQQQGTDSKTKEWRWQIHREVGEGEERFEEDYTEPMILVKETRSRA